MIPAAFEYKRAGSAAEAIALIGEAGDEAKFLAGGHSLLPLMKLRLASPTMLIDIGRVSDLSYIRDAGDHIAIGALTKPPRPSRPIDAPQAEHGAVAGTTPHRRGRRPAGAPPRHHRRLHRPRRPGRPTCLPACCWLSAARSWPRAPTASARSPPPTSSPGFLESGPFARRAAHRDPRSQDRHGAGWSFQKFNRRAQDWAIVGVAAWRNGTNAGVALVNMGQTPVLASSVSNAIAQGASVADAANLATAEASPSGDLNASVEYREHLAKVLVRRALDAC